MLVKFANAEVEIWKLRRGTLVRYDYSFTYITDIGAVDLIDGYYLVRLYMENCGLEGINYSDRVEWLEPH